MNYFKVLSIAFCLLTSLVRIDAQTFKASVLTGLNAGQIDGDFEVGYNKLGLSAGIGIGVNIKPNMMVSTEFLYSQRGSKNGLFRRDGVPNGSIRIDYISLPVVYKLYDWYQEDKDYYQVWIEGGLAPGRLITANITGSDQPELIEDFRTTDVSWLLGAGYHITENLFCSFRYTRSISPFYVAENAGANDVQQFLSYFLTLRVGYQL